MTTCICLCLTLAAASPAAGDWKARLEPAGDTGPGPYGAARLTVSNASETVVRGLAIRWRRGGPSFVHPVAVAPGAEASITVALPAMSVQQVFDVSALADAGDPRSTLSTAAAEIEWDPQHVRPEAFLNAEAYESWLDAPPVWPEVLRKALIGAAALFCIAVTASLFIRRAAVRVGVVVALAVAATVAACVVLPRQPVLIERNVSDDDGRPLVILTTHRTTDWQTPATDLIPLYYSKGQMRDDTMVVRAAAQMSLTIRPGQVRLFRKPVDKPPR